jgi:hypothetical protein
MNVLSHDVLQENAQLIQLSIIGVLKPSKDLNSIVWLLLKVVADVINYNRFRNVSAKHAEIFDINAIVIFTVLTVQPMRNELIFLLDIV